MFLILNEGYLKDVAVIAEVIRDWIKCVTVSIAIQFAGKSG